MGLTTLLGAAQLGVQDAVRRGVINERAPNFIVVSLRRDRVTQEFGSDAPDVRRRIRRELTEAIGRSLLAHNWIVGGCGAMVVNVFIRTIDRDVAATARMVDSVARLRIHDDDGDRHVPVVAATTVIGREHRPSPPGFIPVRDAMRLISRQHIRLEYEDLTLTAIIVGRNPTTLNGNPCPAGNSLILSNGDVLRSGTCEIVIEDISV